MNYSVCEEKIEISFDKSISDKDIEYLQKDTFDELNVEILIDEDGITISSNEDEALSQCFKDIDICLRKRKIKYIPFFSTELLIKDEELNSREIMSYIFTINSDEAITPYSLKYATEYENFPFLVNIDAQDEKLLFVSVTTVYREIYELEEIVGKTLSFVHKIFKHR